MPTSITQQVLTGERALFKGRDLDIRYATFADGESPLKESRNVRLYRSSFKWKYPLWYSENAELVECTLFEMARSGIWYTKGIAMTDCTVEAPKTFRRSSGIRLTGVTMPNANETLWTCSDVRLENVTAKGDYFGMNSSDVVADGFNLVGNYSFDGARNVTVSNARMLSKDAFWNCENVTVRDSFIYGEYLGWNSKNVVFENCVIESLQGMCYMEGVTLKGCTLLNTNLAFEYSTVEAEILSSVDSVLNPCGGSISAPAIGEVTFDDPAVDPAVTRIVVAGVRGDEA